MPTLAGSMSGNISDPARSSDGLTTRQRSSVKSSWSMIRPAVQDFKLELEGEASSRCFYSDPYNNSSPPDQIIGVLDVESCGWVMAMQS